MEELIASLVSLIVLIPIIYFLPMGLTKKGKGIVIIIAFIFANLGILASTNFSPWQTGLIILLLTILTVYILDKRFKKLFFSANMKEMKNSESPEVEIEDPELAKVGVKSKVIAEGSSSESVRNKVEPMAHPPLKQDDRHDQDEQIDIEKLSFAKTTTEEFEEEISVLEGFREVAVTVEDISEPNDIEIFERNSEASANELTDNEIEIAEEQEFTDNKIEQPEDELLSEIITADILPQDSLTDETEDIEVDEEVAFLSNRDVWFEEKDSFEDSFTSSADHEEVEYTGYMSEIEELLEGELLEEHLFQPDETIEETSSAAVEEQDLNIEHTDEESLEADTLTPDVESHTELLEDDVEIPIIEFADMGNETITEADFASMDEGESTALDLESELEVFVFEDKQEAEREESNITALEAVELEEPWLPNEDSIDEEDKLQSETTLHENELSIAEVEPPFIEELAEKNSLSPEESEFLEEEPQTEIEQHSKTATDEHKSTQEKKTVLQQQLFQTMVSQLHLARRQMYPREYEELIIQHLHPELPAQDYYTFVSLLIEHYISQKEIGKLQGLLTNLEGKFENYPILDMEIHYLYKQYCENIR